MIEEEQPPIEGEPEAELEPEFEDVEPLAKSPWKAFVLTGLLAGLIGAVGGAAAVYFALERQMSHRYLTAQPIKADLQQELRSETNKLNRRFEAVELQLANLPELSAMAEPADLSVLEKRLTALETAPVPEIDPEALSALQAAQKDGFKWPDTKRLEDKVAALEVRAETFSDTAATVATAPDGLIERLNNLETELETLRNVEPRPAVD